ncbi:hypothetical protein BDP67DRAFT_561557 [Colletotrichum lupini]|nr:hypothetical protein BDP67DRAFT_561557 [Colletotrichum lupini]
MATQLGRTLSREWVLNIATLIQVVCVIYFLLSTYLTRYPVVAAVPFSQNAKPPDGQCLEMQGGAMSSNFPRKTRESKEDHVVPSTMTPLHTRGRTRPLSIRGCVVRFLPIASHTSV